MKLLRIGALFLALFTSIGLMAQNKLYFVEDITEDGQPVGHSNTWAISPSEGGNIYMLYTNNNKPITDAELGIKVEIKNDAGNYELFDELTVETEKGKKWLLFSVPFTQIGVYRVTIQSVAKKNLAVETLELVFAEEEEVSDNITDEYARGYTITFCDSVDADGNPVKPRKEFKLHKGKVSVGVFFSHPDGLRSDTFIMKITKAGSNAGEPVELEISCDASWGAFIYNYEFTSAGTYTIGVMTPSGKVLNFDMVTIK